MVGHEHSWLGLDSIGVAWAMAGGAVVLGICLLVEVERLSRRVKRLEKSLKNRT